MELGLISSYDSGTSSGQIINVEGEKLSFRYEQGQSLQFGEGLPTPQYSGQHDQPGGGALKQPDVGDPVIYQKSDDGNVAVWGYARHFVELSEKRYPTRFVTE